MTSQLFAQWDSIQDAIADVRSDQTATNWMLCGYVGNATKELELKGKGEGGINELKEQLAENNAFYGLARIEEMIDSSLTIKFAFVKFVGENIKPMNRASITPQVGEITSRFKPYHVDLFITTKDEISQEIIEDLVGKASMSRTKIMEKHEGEKIQKENEDKQRRLGTTAPSTTVTTTSAPSTTSSTTTTTSSPKPRSTSTVQSSSPRTAGVSAGSAGSGGLEFDNLEEIQQAIRDVRADSSGTNWMAVTYAPNSKTKITLLGSGSGGVNEMKQQWNSTGVYFGLVRVTEIIDESETVKFAFVHMLGDNTPMMLKARVSTHKGQIEALLQPYHTTLFATNTNEITDEEISILVAKASQSYKWEIKK